MKKALVVDDIQGWRNFNSEILTEIFNDNICIDTADGAKYAHDLIINNISEPYDIIITDLQMEDDFRPKYAGEWLVEQIKTYREYSNSKIVLVSSSYNIKAIAELLGVNSIQKSTAIKCLLAYKEIFGK